MGQIWKSKVSLQEINKFHDNTLERHLGIEIVEIGDNYLKTKMPVDQRTKQPLGLLHGGASAALAESAGSIASFLCIENIDLNVPVGIEINASHMKSATKGYVYATTSPLRIGRRLHVWNTEIRDEDDELICISRLTVMLVSRKKQ